MEGGRGRKFGKDIIYEYLGNRGDTDLPVSYSQPKVHSTYFENKVPEGMETSGLVDELCRRSRCRQRGRGGERGKN